MSGLAWGQVTEWKTVPLSIAKQAISGVAVDRNGNLYVARGYYKPSATNENWVWKATPGADFNIRYAGNFRGTPGYWGDGAKAFDAGLKNPVDLDTDAAGNLYIADTYNHAVRMVNAATGIINTVVGDGSGLYGSGGDGGLATSARLYYPMAVAVDAQGNLYIADQGNHRIRRVDAVTRIITTVAGNGTSGHSGDGGAATLAKIFSPTDVTVDNRGDIYIADYNNRRVRKVDAVTGVITTVAGGPSLPPQTDGVPATLSYLARPLGVATDGASNIYIATEDTTYNGTNGRIRKVDASTGAITTLASGFLPWGMDTDVNGNIMVADVYNRRILRITGSPPVTNHPPEAPPQSVAVSEDQSATITLAASDVDGDALTFAFTTQPLHGALSLTGSSATYTAAPNYSGGDSFTYTVTDGRGGSATGTVSITVTPVNDPPVAGDQLAAVAEDGSAIINLASSDVDGDPLTFALASQPAHGSVVLAGNVATYTPTPDYHGSDTFVYTVSDGQGGTATGTVTVTVAPVNDPPVADALQAPAVEDGSVEITLGGTDPDGDALTFALASQPVHGSVVLDGYMAVYAPAANYNGSDSFTYSVSDGFGGTAVATVSVAVRAVNDAPSFTKGPDQTVLADAGPLAANAWATSLSTGPANESGQTLSFIVSNDSNGLFSVQPAVDAAGTLTYTPAASGNGMATVTVRIHDDGGTANNGVDTSDPQEFVVTVQSPNRPPVADAGPDQTVEATGPTTTPVTLNGTGSSDLEGGPLTYTWVENNTVVAGPSTSATAQVELGLGTHTIVLTVDDGQVASATPSGNPVERDETVVVRVVDTTPPALALNGPAAMALECHVDTYSETATASDACDGNPALVINGSVDTHTPGIYTLTYTATDASGNAASVTRVVTVVDTRGPAISLGGAAEVTLESHVGTYIEQGATASDECDGDLSARIVVTGGVDVEVPGTYVLTYSVADHAGHSASTARTVRVVDTTPPVVMAPADVSVEATGPQTAVAIGTATATDLVGVVSISSDAPATFPLGTTMVTWTATDAAGNAGTATQPVLVRDTAAPVVTAALTAISRSRDEDEDEDGNFYRVTAIATDLVDPSPVVSAHITQPLTSSTPMVVGYKRDRRNRIQIKTEKRRLQVQLAGPSEANLRRLWGEVLRDGGLVVSDGQEVQLVVQKDKKDEYQAQYQFDRALKLTSAKGPGLGLMVWARDLSGNQAQVMVALGKRARSGEGGGQEVDHGDTRGENDVRRDGKLVGEGSLPASFGLEANYPNPFNPSTTLRYNLTEAGQVQLTVHNVVGQQVRVLVDQVQEAGAHQIEWDGRDQSGQAVAPGLYLYRLVAGSQALGKMVLVR
jgi:hypothetical protein